MIVMGQLNLDSIGIVKISSFILQNRFKLIFTKFFDHLRLIVFFNSEAKMVDARFLILKKSNEIRPESHKADVGKLMKSLQAKMLLIKSFGFLDIGNIDRQMIDIQRFKGAV